MFRNYHNLDIFDYICAQNAQCWARITKIDMEIQRYNRQKNVLAEKERTGTCLSEQKGHSIGTISHWMTNKMQPSVEQLYEIARHLDVDVKELLYSTKKGDRDRKVKEIFPESKLAPSYKYRTNWITFYK